VHTRHDGNVGSGRKGNRSIQQFMFHRVSPIQVQAAMIKLGRDCWIDQPVIADLTNLKPIVLVFSNIQIHIYMIVGNRRARGRNRSGSP
jgi:hypothetical protein